MSYSAQSATNRTELQNFHPTLLAGTPFERSHTKEQQDAPSAFTSFLEQQFLLQKQLLERSVATLRSRQLQTPEVESKNSIWNPIKLVERFSKEEYQSPESRRELLRFDALHHAKEMALVEPITRFSYWHQPESNETLGDGYSEDIAVMLNAFTQEITQKGLESSRASIEALSFERAKARLSQIAEKKLHAGSTETGILITSFPDDEAAGYHGTDSKYDWDKPETYHSFFYFLRVGKIETDDEGNILRFEILTTQYRLWPNIRQALELHETLGAPIDSVDAPVPNLLFANLIELTETDLEKAVLKLSQQKNSNYFDKESGPHDPEEISIEKLLKSILYQKSQEHARSYLQSPDIPLQAFWKFQAKYFEQFYLTEALPVFQRLEKLFTEQRQLTQQMQQLRTHREKQAVHKKLLSLTTEIQHEIDFLDKAFYYYSQAILGWIKIHNLNPDYEAAFFTQSIGEKIKKFQQKILFQILGNKQQTDTLPTVEQMSTALNIDHRIATNQPVSSQEKKKLLSVWGFFSELGNISSLLQCGTIAPFTAPISIMNRSFDAASVASFSQSLGSFSAPERKKLLDLFQSEDYVELDLREEGAKKIYTVPKSYLQPTSTGEPGCVVNEKGEVLGPCIDPSTQERIPLDDPKDTMAFPLTMEEFQKYILELQASVQNETLTKLNEFFDSPLFSKDQQKKARYAIKRIKQKFIKDSVGLDEFFTGDVLAKNQATHEWLQELLLKLSFSLNPVETLILAVQEKLELETKQKKAATTVDEIIAELDQE